MKADKLQFIDNAIWLLGYRGDFLSGFKDDEFAVFDLDADKKVFVCGRMFNIGHLRYKTKWETVSFNVVDGNIFIAGTMEDDCIEEVCDAVSDIYKNANLKRRIKVDKPITVHQLKKESRCVYNDCNYHVLWSAR